MLESIDGLVAEHAALQVELADSAIHTNPARAKKLNRRYSELNQIVLTHEALSAARDDLAAAKELAKDDEVFAAEIAPMESSVTELEEKLRRLLIPRDPDDGRDVIMEIKGGEGGAESALFAADLLRMYTQYADSRGWRVEILDRTDSDLGGFKDVQLAIKSNATDPANGAWAKLKYEGGVHRVQRVPETESQGRVHTSAITVAVLPEAEEVDFELDMNDVRKDTFRASGAGGQHINKTESAIRLTHIPTGTVVECQDGRSQHKNLEKAISVLRSRLYQIELDRVHNERAAQRKTLVSSGDRSAKIRTYNYPQGRITDHRINKTMYNLSNFMNGDVQEMIDALKMAENAEKLKGE